MVWPVAEAKARFSELIDTARQDGVQEVTRNGKLVGLFVSPEDWGKRQREPLQNQRSTAAFFRNSPLKDSGLDLARSRSKIRKVSL